MIYVLAWCTLSGTVVAESEKEVSMKPAQASAIIPVQDRPLELSGCAVVDGGLLVVEDELIGSVLFVSDLEATPLVVSTIKLERKKKSRKPYGAADKLFPIQDFEDIASDGKERVFFLGSHQGKGGERRPDREFLIAAKWDKKQKELKVTGEQYRVLDQIAPLLKRAGLDVGVSPTTVDPEFNLEGLAFDGERLYLGLRGPQTQGGESVIVSAPVSSIFQGNGEASWATQTLALEGAGIRALDWDPRTQQLLVLSGPSSSDVGVSALWRSTSEGAVMTNVYRFPDEVAEKAPEGVCRLPESVGGELLVVLDGGGMVRIAGI